MANKEAKNKGLVIRLKKGRIACNPNQRACLQGLGLKKRHQEVSLENTPAVRGMVKKVLHLVEILADT
jgi:large subunit ribosomal protein L30